LLHNLLCGSGLDIYPLVQTSRHNQQLVLITFPLLKFIGSLLYL
jgi:hypothetical protein